MYATTKSQIFIYQINGQTYTILRNLSINYIYIILIHTIKWILN